MKKLEMKSDSIEMVEDFSDECLNIFKIVFLIQKPKKQLRKIGVMFYDNQILQSPFEKIKLMIEVLLLRNFFKWEIVLINQGSEYELQKASEFILGVVTDKTTGESL